MRRSLSAVTLAVSILLALPAAGVERVVAIEEGGGGGGEGSSGGSTAASSDGGSTAGGRHGHSTIQLTIMATFTANRLYPAVLTPSPDRDTTRLTETEQAFLCSMSRIRSESPRIRAWFPTFLASLISRPVEMVIEGLKSDVCPKPLFERNTNSL